QAFKFHPNNFLSPLATMIVCLFLLLVVVGALAISQLVRPAPQQANLPPSAVVGHVFFQDDALGHNDLLRLELHNVSTPSQGQRYYAWYQNAAGQAFPLGPLTLSKGTATLLYSGDAHHTNLLSTLQTV